MPKNKESNAFFWGFVLGAVAGAALTLLKTPRSGKETIGEIRARGRQLRSRGDDFAKRSASQVGDLAHSAQTQVDKAQSQASDLANQAKNDLQTAGEAIVDTAADALDNGADAASDALDSTAQ
jgi:gas vesicle protein